MAHKVDVAGESCDSAGFAFGNELASEVIHVCRAVSIHHNVSVFNPDVAAVALAPFVSVDNYAAGCSECIDGRCCDNSLSLPDSCNLAGRIHSGNGRVVRSPCHCLVGGVLG